MKKISILFALSITLLAACTKNKNTITGRINYKDATGFAYIASGADVYVMSSADKAGVSSSYKTKSGSDGSYSFADIKDGDWYVYATYTKDTLLYQGKCDLFKVKGDEAITRDFVLQR